jgi:hypothetical protein
MATAGSGMLLRVSHCLRAGFAVRRQATAVAFPHLPQMLAATADVIAPIAVSVEMPNPVAIGIDRPNKGVAADEYDIFRRCTDDKDVGRSRHIFFHHSLIVVDRLRCVVDRLRRDVHGRRGDDHCRRAYDDLGPTNVDLSLGRQCEASQGACNQSAVQAKGKFGIFHDGFLTIN